MAASEKKMKRKIKSSNYKNSWLLECNDIDRPIAEKQLYMMWCLEHGADPSVASSCGSSPLHAATRRVEPQIVHMLIKHKADVNRADHNGETPLHLAMRVGDGTAHILEPLDPEDVEKDDMPQLREVRIVDMLLGSADTNKADNCGDTPLHVAVRSGEESVVYLLMKHNADVNVKNNTGETALHLAAHRGEAPIFKALLSHSSDVNTPNGTGNTPLHLAAHRGQVSIVRMLLGSDADVKITNSDGDTPLHMATRSGKTEIAKLLLEAGAEVNKKNDADFTPLHVAADAGKEEIVELLLALQAEVDTTNNAGNTPLHLAVLQGHSSIVILLLKHGVNVNIQNSAGDTSLYLAVLHGEPATVELLLDRGANSDITSKAGNAPLHVAAYLGKSLIVDLLLNSKADVNKKDSAGNTALHLAARRQHVRVVRSLLRHKADVTIRNSDWNTPLTVARVFHFEGNEEIVSLLQNARKTSDPLALLNEDRSQPLSDTSQTNNQVAILNSNLQIDTPFQHLDTDTPSLFPKRADTAGLAGQLYESKLLCLVLLRALNDEEIEDFVLGTNVRGIGDIDDICMRYRVRGQDKPILLLVQAKHREDSEKGRVTVEDVRSVSGDYSLRKYFDSYLTLKDRFQATDKDPEDLMLVGDLAKIECNLIIYTPGMDCFTKKNTKNQVSAKVDYLINTAGQNLINTKDKSLMNATDITEVFQYNYDENDLENLNRMSVLERLKKSGANFLNKIMAEKENPKIILVDKLIARFHVVMGREVLKPCDNQEANEEYRVWEFRPQFFESDSEYLLALKETFVKELSSKRCDLSKLTQEDQVNFKQVIQTPDAATISKLIGKLVTYKTKKLKPIEITTFKKKFKTDVYNSLLKQFDDIEIDENVINEAVRIKLEKMKIKLPLSFGNLDMTFRGNKDRIQKRMIAVADKIIQLLKINKDQTRPVLEINDDDVGSGRTIEQGFIEINGGIGSAVGNLLVFDPDTKMLKFNLDGELPTNAASFSKELTHERHDLTEEILIRYRIKIDVDGFPKASLDGDGYGEKIAKEYLSKVWFYTDQAKQDEVEDIIKSDIDKYYNNEKDSQIKFEIHSDAIYRSAHRELQEWWKQTGKVKYLSKKTDFFQKAKLECFNNLMLAVMYHIYESRIYSIDFKFNPVVQQSDASIQAAAAFDIVFGQKYKIFDKQSKRINTDCSPKIKELVQYAEQLANYYVAASSDPSMIQNILDHPESQGNIVVNIVQNNVEHEFDLNEFQYSKRGGTSEMSGQLYKTKLLCLVHLRALNDDQIEDFVLATSIRDIGGMDDICLRYRIKGQNRPIALFLQAKHKEDANLTVEDVLNTSGEFSLQKYFKSYLKIRNRFQADEKDFIFQGDFGDLDWNFIIYTPASDSFSNKRTGRDVSEKVDFLISTNFQKKSFQYDYEESEIDSLVNILLHERLKKLGAGFLEFAQMFKNDDSEMLDKLTAQYHVILGREVLQTCTEQQTNNKYRMWEFRPEFFTKNCEYLDTLRKTFVTELSTKNWDQSKITKEDKDNFMSVLKDPCASKISKLIGKLAVYNNKSKKLQLVASFRTELMASDKFTETEQIHEIQINENVISEAILMRLQTMIFKLPFSFGNLDMTFPGCKTKKTEVADNLKRLLEINTDSKVVNISDIMGTDQDLKDTYSCIESAFGNLLVLDPHTKMLKFNLKNETLADNAAWLLKELKEHKPINEELNNFRFKVSIDEFPKDSFDADENDKKQVLDFLSRLWFYTNQAKEDEVELILKDEINRFYSNIGRNCSAYCGSLPELILLSAHDDVQKWWMQTSESPYLTRASELFERAKDAEIGNLLWTVINFMFISKTSSVDIKFKQRVSKYFKFVKMHQIFNKMSGTLFSLFDKQFDDTINIELPVITEPAPYSNYSSLGELVFSLEIHTTLETMEWVAMKMWAVSTFTQYFLLAKGGPEQNHRPARDGFLLQQLCNGRNGHLIEGERDPDDMYSFVTTKFH